MNGEIGIQEKQDEVDDDFELSDDPDATVVIEEDVAIDNVGDISVEINVEELVAKLEATDDSDVRRKREIKQRLEELREQRDAEAAIDSTYNFNMDEDL